MEFRKLFTASVTDSFDSGISLLCLACVSTEAALFYALLIHCSTGHFSICWEQASSHQEMMQLELMAACCAGFGEI